MSKIVKPVVFAVFLFMCIITVVDVAGSEETPPAYYAAKPGMLAADYLPKYDIFALIGALWSNIKNSTYDLNDYLKNLSWGVAQEKTSPLKVSPQPMAPPFVQQIVEREPELPQNIIKTVEEVDLLQAVNSGSLEKVKELVEKGADTSIKDSDGQTALVIAMKKGLFDIFTYLLKVAKDKKQFDVSSFEEFVMQTAEYDRPEMLKLLIKEYRFFNILFPAISKYNASLAVVKKLVDAGANVNGELKSYEYQPLRLVAKDRKKFDIFQYLVEAGANLDKYSKDIADDAAYGGNLEVVTYLFNKKIKLDKNNLLLEAAGGRDAFDLVKYLVDNGADVNARTTLKKKDLSASQRTPLHIAAERGRFSVVKYLFEHGADIFAQDALGRSVLYTAAGIGCVAEAGGSESAKLYNAIVKWLVEQGANLYVKTKEGKTVFDVLEQSCPIKDYLISIRDFTKALSANDKPAIIDYLKKRFVDSGQTAGLGLKKTSKEDISDLLVFIASRADLSLLDRFYLGLTETFRHDQLKELGLYNISMPDLCLVMVAKSANDKIKRYWLKTALAWCKIDIRAAQESTYEGEVNALINKLNKDDRDDVEKYYRTEILPKQKMHKLVIKIPKVSVEKVDAPVEKGFRDIEIFTKKQ